MNNFPTMTEEQRQELISGCKAEIASIEALINWHGSSAHLNGRLLRQQIALAALKAQPDFYVHESDTHRINDECGAAVWAHRVKTDGDIGVYTAPPVPELKRNNEKLAREIVCRLVDIGEADPEVVDIHKAWVLNKLNGVN